MSRLDSILNRGQAQTGPAPAVDLNDMLLRPVPRATAAVDAEAIPADIVAEAVPRPRPDAARPAARE